MECIRIFVFNFSIENKKFKFLSHKKLNLKHISEAFFKQVRDVFEEENTKKKSYTLTFLVRNAKKNRMHSMLVSRHKPCILHWVVLIACKFRIHSSKFTVALKFTIFAILTIAVFTHFAIQS